MNVRLTFFALAIGFLPPILDAAGLTLNFADGQGEILKNVEVHLAPSAGQPGEAQYRKSDKRGIAKFDSVKPGHYLLQAQLNGFMSLRLTLDLAGDEQLNRVLLKKSEFATLEQHASEALSAGHAQESLEVCQKLLQNYPEDPVLHDRLARASAEIPDRARALAEAQQAANLDPQFASTRAQVLLVVLRVSGRNALKAQDFAGAIAAFEALKAEDPKDSTAYHGLALAYGHVHRYQDALQAIETAITLDPSDANLKNVRAILLNNSASQNR